MAVELASAYVAGGGPAVAAAQRQAPAGPDHPAPDPLSLARRVRATGGTVVAVGGCFDVLHAGHVRMLADARLLGDCLVVCLNSDDSMTRHKGPGRPVNTVTDQAAVLLALRTVDAVLVFEEDTPAQVLEELKPDVFVKGGDYAMTEIEEMAVLRRLGGETVVVPYSSGFSTTSLLQDFARAAGE